MLWKATFHDIVSIGAQYFFPRLKGSSDILHLGTREFQLFMLKTSLMLGVHVVYASELIGLSPPQMGLLDKSDKSQWIAKIRKKQSSSLSTDSKTCASKSEAKSALAFKPNKQGMYEKTYKCNAMEWTEVDKDFVNGRREDQKEGTENVTSIPFNSLIVAEGEWSTTTRALGFNKSIDKFGPALGLVINFAHNPKNKMEKRALSFSCNTSADVHKTPLGALKREYNISAESMEYLKGTTHYIVLCIYKKSLLSFGCLKNNEKSSAKLLRPENLNIEKLKELSLCIASVCKLPKDKIQFYKKNPIQLFDFSTRARALISMKILGLSTDDSNGIALDGTAESFSKIENTVAGKTALVLPVGDAILEPFWPQGLGTNRGFHTSMNAVFIALGFRETKRNLKWSIKESFFSYQALRWVAWHPSFTVTPFKNWSVDYVDRLNPNTIKDMLKEKRKSGKESQVPNRLIGKKFSAVIGGLK